MKKSLIALSVVIVLLVSIYLVYSFIISRIYCESIFKQTSLRLQNNLDIIKVNGDVFIGEAKIQDLIESSQMTALDLKTCCIAFEEGKLSPDKFQRYKNSAEKYEEQIEKIAININEAQAAKLQGKTELFNEKVSRINQTINVAKMSYGEFYDQFTEFKAAQLAERSEDGKFSETDSEQEPNNTILDANSFLMNTRVSGEISNKDDMDYFKFRSNLKLGDRVKVNFENLSKTLVPEITVYNSNKSKMFDKANWTPGANLEFDFVSEPGKDYYLEIRSHDNTDGKYKLTVNQDSVT